MAACCAVGCENRKSHKSKRQLREEQSKQITFHRFPKDKARKKEWIASIRRANWKPSDYSVVCSEHFSEECFDRTSLCCVRLRSDAIPTIFKGFPSYLQKLIMISNNRHCFVPGCKSGYSTTKAKNAKLGLKNKHLFRAKTQFQVEQWRKVIPRLDREYQRHNAVCELHFEDQFIEKYYKTNMPDGTCHLLERDRPKLTHNAVPSIFPTFPVNCSKTVKRHRKCPALSKAAQDEPSMTSSTVADSGNSDERRRIEANPLRDVNRETKTASPPQEESFPADEDSGDASSVVYVKPDVDTLLNNETEQMWADRERIMKHPYECCRLCLERSDDLTDISQGTKLGLVIRLAIKDFLHFEVVRKGKSPWQVCYACMQKLSDFQEFKDRCVETKILWDDCSNYIDEDSTAYNTRSSAIQSKQHSESDVISGGTVNPNKHDPMDNEKTGNEMITAADGDDADSREYSVMDEDCEIYDLTEFGLVHDAAHPTEDFPSVMGTPRDDDDSAELDGEGCESHLNPVHHNRTQVHQNTEPSSVWPEDKENSTDNQVKGIYELDDSKGSDGEPLVLILKVNGAIELCTLSEIPPNMRSRIQKYSKMTGNHVKKKPREKGD